MADNLTVGAEYLIRANGATVLAVYTGMAEPPGDDRELPRFLPVRWLSGEPDDPAWPVYAGPRASVRPVSVRETSRDGPQPRAVTRGGAWARFLAALGVE